ncbi:hypothetical protein [Nocardia brasiliensis]|uniref:hypothetical protein n=1 Tax=Nocardia brasiliensis TaxID=37326 RepID=UPI003D913854
MDSNRSEDSAHPKSGPATGADVAYLAPNEQHRNPISSTAAINWRDRELLTALDGLLYIAPYVLIQHDNTKYKTTSDLADARQALAHGTVSSVAGSLRPGTVGADIDPTVEKAIRGDLCAEALVAWCAKRGLAYVVRESGRPGGRHVIAVARNQRDVTDWAKLCTRLTRKNGVTVDNRTGKALRLLSAPHRQGRPAPVIGGTLTPRDVLDCKPLRTAPAPRQAQKPSNTRRRATSERDQSRSGREYGLACAMVRAGYTAAQAWTHEALIGGKSARNGELWWRRYIWMPATVVVAAEQDVGEDEAWQRSLRAAPVGCRKMGRDDWRGLWQRAVREAATDRPRRYRIGSTEQAPETRARIDATSRGLRAAAAELIPARPQRRHSIAALLHALATVIVLREGSVSSRDLSERSLLDAHTVRAARRDVIQAGVVSLVHQYAGGPDDCDAYGIGPAAESYINAAQHQTSPTSCSSPPGPTGHCNAALLRSRYSRDSRHWRLRCTALSSLLPGETLATSQHPLAKALRSLWFQRKWWQSLTSDEQAHRRSLRRQLLESMSRADTSAWFGWLARREEIANAADRLLHGDGSASDEATVGSSPRTLHRGMRDPQWRTGGTPSTPPEQPELAA